MNVSPIIELPREHVVLTLPNFTSEIGKGMDSPAHIHQHKLFDLMV